MKLQQALPLDEQESFIMQTPSGVVSELDPRTHYAEAQFESTAEVEVAISLANKNPSAAVNMVKALSAKRSKQCIKLSGGFKYYRSDRYW